MFLYIKCSGSKSVILEIIVLCYVIKNTKRVTDWTTAKPATFYQYASLFRSKFAWMNFYLKWIFKIETEIVGLEAK